MRMQIDSKPFSLQQDRNEKGLLCWLDMAYLLFSSMNYSYFFL